MNGPVARTGTPWDDLTAELREVILTTRPDADADLIERACEVAGRCHQGQMRRSGDPYITHPVAVAQILARLDDVREVDDQTLCAAILHDTVQDTPYTLAALRREFGTGIAAMVAGHMTLDRLGRQPARQVTRATATMMGADTRVVTAKLADRLHNMQTLQFLPRAKQLRKTREVLDTFLPVAEQLRMHTLRSELQALAFAALIRNQPLRAPCRRVIVALDIEGSTSRPDLVKAELRTMLYELFDAALRSAGVSTRRRDRFTDRGDGLLALIDPAVLGYSGGPAPGRIRSPGPGQVKRPVDERAPGRGGIGQVDCDLGVLGPSRGAGVLPLHPAVMMPFLRSPVSSTTRTAPGSAKCSST